eukprot:scaffold322195_cov33-Tisochrysis_lutea.AAC.2
MAGRTNQAKTPRARMEKTAHAKQASAQPWCNTASRWSVGTATAWPSEFSHTTSPLCLSLERAERNNPPNKGSGEPSSLGTASARLTNTSIRARAAPAGQCTARAGLAGTLSPNPRLPFVLPSAASPSLSGVYRMAGLPMATAVTAPRYCLGTKPAATKCLGEERVHPGVLLYAREEAAVEASVGVPLGRHQQIAQDI